MALEVRDEFVRKSLETDCEERSEEKSDSEVEISEKEESICSGAMFEDNTSDR